MRLTDLRPRWATDDFLGIALKLLATVAISLYPSVTSVALKHELQVLDVLLLRYGVSALVFFPYLISRRSSLSGKKMAVGLLLALLNGVGMAFVAVSGLTFAPAAHQAILGPPTVAVWVVVLGFACFGIRPTRANLWGIIFISVGIVLLLRDVLATARTTPFSDTSV